MAVLHLVERSHRLVISSYSGEVTLEQVVSACEGLRRNPDFHPDHRQLADLSQVSNLDLHFEDMAAIREHDPFSKRARRALFVPERGATFGLARMYETVVDADELGVFSSLLDALAWLDLDVTVLGVPKARGSRRDSYERTANLTMPTKVSGSHRPATRKEAQKVHSSGR